MMDQSNHYFQVMNKSIIHKINQ